MIYRFGPFELDDSTRELRRDGELVDTEPKAFDLLVHLIRHRDRAVSKDELLAEVWPNQIVTETALTRAIMKARRAVADDSDAQSVIRTLHGHGYRFVGDLDADAAPEPAAPAEPQATLESTDRRARFYGFIAAIVLVIAVGTGYLLLRDNPPDPEPGTLAVLPVVDLTENTELEWVKVGLMSLMGRMLQDSGVSVASERAVLRAVGDAVLAKPPDPETFANLRRQANADAVLHTVLDVKGGLHRLAAVVTHADGRRTRRIIVGESPAALAAELSGVIAGIMESGDRDDDRRFRKVSTDPFVNELYARALDLELQGELAEARDLFELASTQEPELFWLRYEIALCTRDLEEYDKAKPMFEALLEEARSGADVRAKVATLNSYGLMYLNQFDYESATPYLQEALDATSERTYARDRATVLTNLALIANRKGEINVAQDYYEQILAAHEESGDDPSPFFFNNYAGLLMHLGDLDKAETYSKRAVTEFQLRGQRRYEAPATNRLAKILRRKGDIDGAIAGHEKAAQIYRDLGNSGGEITVQSAITNVYRQKGDLTRARVNAQNVLERSIAAGDDFHVANAHLQIGYVEAQAGDHEAAMPAFEAALEGFLPKQDDRATRAVRSAMARSLLELGRIEEAGTIADELLTTALSVNHEPAAANAQVLQGMVLIEQGNDDEAAERLKQALSYARLNNDDTVRSNAAAFLADIEIRRGNHDDAQLLVDEVRELAATDHDFLRLDARLAIAQGENARAAEILTDLRQQAGEGWNEEDAALLASASSADE